MPRSPDSIGRLDVDLPHRAAPIPAESDDPLPEAGVGLCLSGGGYRAMLFHTGALMRLNATGGLRTIDRVSSVSGGSITAALLGLAWGALDFDENGIALNFREEVVAPLRGLARQTIDWPSVASGLLWAGSVSRKLAEAYRKRLFGDATLADLPDAPRFVINATNVQSGALWRFSKPYMRDWKVGEIEKPGVALADAVAASSAFPPFLSPLELSLKSMHFSPRSGELMKKKGFRERTFLSDGGVYDNLGLEAVWKRYDTILVSDAGGGFKIEAKPRRNWGAHAYRVLNLIDHQVRSLRKRQVIGAFELRNALVGAGEPPDSELARRVSRSGAYWGIRTDVNEYPVADKLPCDFRRTSELADVSTRLASMDDRLQERLINWGFAVCDAAMRSFVKADWKRADFPYPGGVG